METLTKVNLDSPRVKKVITDSISHSITGELIGMANFASLADTIEDIEEKMEAVEHAESERQHALGFIDMARKYDMEPIINTDGIYWKTMRDNFKKYARKGDFISCLVIQEVMLESYAVSMYRDLGKAIGGEIGELFLQTSEEEKEHLEHSSDILQDEFKIKGNSFVEHFHTLHLESMTVLAEFAAQTDLKGHCGVCNGTCMKDDLDAIGLNVKVLRANALKTYAEALDNIGLPTEETTRWIVQLPL
ncbi:MAG: long-chain fatty aldehyde decarbonylase [Saprospiraceae bacterium]|nr:long-chain fatty aldehyde decarbonylase [Saprospiraceae bacterium]